MLLLHTIRSLAIGWVGRIHLVLKHLGRSHSICGLGNWLARLRVGDGSSNSHVLRRIVVEVFDQTGSAGQIYLLLERLRLLGRLDLFHGGLELTHFQLIYRF